MYQHTIAVHVHDIVTDWSYALAEFLVSTLFPTDVLLSGFPFFFSTICTFKMKCVSGTSRVKKEFKMRRQDYCYVELL